MHTKPEHGFSVVGVVLLLAVLAAVGLSGWWVYAAHNPKPSTVITAPKASKLDGPQAEIANSLNLVLSAYNTYDKSGLAAIKGKLSDQLYSKISTDMTTGDVGHDEITCGQMGPLKETGGNAPNRVSEVSYNAEKSAVVQVDGLSSYYSNNNSYYFTQLGLR